MFYRPFWPCCKQYHSLSSSSSKNLILSEFIKTITLRTCVGIYDELRLIHPKLYKNAPSKGIDLNIDYVDTRRPNENRSLDKVIVAIHGTANNYITFTRLIQHFQQIPNVRVIVPNLPDFNHTRQTNFSFWHSTEEKYHYLKDLLRKLNINRVDCLIGHSLGVQPCCAFLEKPDGIQIKSLVMIAPQFLLDTLSKQHIKIAKFILLFAKSSLATWFLNSIKLHQLPIVPVKLTNIDQLFLLNTTIYDEQLTLQNIEKRIRFLSKLKIPGFILYGSNEYIISKNSVEKLNQLLNIENKILIEEDNPKYISDFGSVKLEGIKSFVLKDGGHFPHARYSKITNELIEKLIFFDMEQSKLNRN